LFLVDFVIIKISQLALFEKLFDTRLLIIATLFMQELGANLLMQSPISASNELVTVWDPEVGKQNPSENKQLKLARSVTRGLIDRELKPSSNEKKYRPF